MNACVLLYLWFSGETRAAVRKITTQMVATPLPTAARAATGGRNGKAAAGRQRHHVTAGHARDAAKASVSALLQVLSHRTELLQCHAARHGARSGKALVRAHACLAAAADGTRTAHARAARRAACARRAFLVSSSSSIYIAQTAT